MKVDHPPTTIPPTTVILTAMRAEADPIITRLGLVADGPWHAGQIGGRRVVVAVAGIGRDRVIQMMEQVSRAWMPASILLAGFAGALDPTLEVGDVIDVKTVIDGRGGAVSLGHPWPRAGHDPGLCLGDDPTGAGAGGRRVLTCDRLVDATQAKRELWLRHGAWAVDMESFHVAGFAAQRELPLRIIRVISDGADTVLPAGAGGWVGPDGRTDVLRVGWDLMRWPRLWPITLRLWLNTRRATRELVRAVESCLRGGGLAPGS